MVFIRKKKKKSEEEIATEREKKEQQRLGIQDEFQAKGFEIAAFLQDNSQLVVAGIGGILLLLAAFTGYTFWQKSAHSQASSAFFQAWKKLEPDVALLSANKEKAGVAKDFEAVATTHDSTGVASLAWLEAGHIALRTGQPKEAVSAYENFLKSKKSKDGFLAVAYMSLAAAHEESGDLKSALEAWSRFLQEGTSVQEDLALFEAFRLSRRLGDETKASDFKKQLIERYADSSYAQKAKDFAPADLGPASKSNTP